MPAVPPPRRSPVPPRPKAAAFSARLSPFPAPAPLPRPAAYHPQKRPHRSPAATPQMRLLPFPPREHLPRSAALPAPAALRYCHKERTPLRESFPPASSPHRPDRFPPRHEPACLKSLRSRFRPHYSGNLPALPHSPSHTWQEPPDNAASTPPKRQNGHNIPASSQTGNTPQSPLLQGDWIRQGRIPHSLSGTPAHPSGCDIHCHSGIRISPGTPSAPESAPPGNRRRCHTRIPGIRPPLLRFPLRQFPPMTPSDHTSPAGRRKGHTFPPFSPRYRPSEPDTPPLFPRRKDIP